MCIDRRFKGKEREAAEKLLREQFNTGYKIVLDKKEEGIITPWREAKLKPITIDSPNRDGFGVYIKLEDCRMVLETCRNCSGNFSNHSGYKYGRIAHVWVRGIKDIGACNTCTIDYNRSFPSLTCGWLGLLGWVD